MELHLTLTERKVKPDRIQNRRTRGFVENRWLYVAPTMCSVVWLGLLFVSFDISVSRRVRISFGTTGVIICLDL